MSIVSLNEVLNYLEIQKGFFEITSVTKSLSFSYNSGEYTEINLEVKTYDGVELATEIQDKIDSAFVASSTVSYDSNTKKFSIDVGAGNTIAYNHDVSSAGLILGFTSSKSDAQLLTSDEEIGDPISIVSVIHDSCEDFVKGFCGRDFEETQYKLEKYNPTNTNKLFLRNFPIIYLDRVCSTINDIIKISNSNTNAITSVSVNSLGLRFVYNGSSDNSILFSSYSTMSSVVSAINSIGNGWSAELTDSNYSTFPSTELIKSSGKSTLNGDIYLSVPGSPFSSFELNENIGLIENQSGNFNSTVYVDYTAGFSADNMPDGLKLAIKMLVQYFYRMIREENLIGVEQYFTGKFRTVMEKHGIPYQARHALTRYKRVIV